MRQAQAQKQSVNVKVVIGEKRKKKSARRVPRRPKRAHIVPPTVQVVQERWFPPQWNPTPPPVVNQTSTAHTVVPQQHEKWTVSTQTTHPFATLAPPAPAPAPSADPPPVAPPAPSAAPPPEGEPDARGAAGPINRKRARGDLNKTQLIALLNSQGIVGINNLNVADLKSILDSDDPQATAEQMKREKRTASLTSRFAPY